MDSSTVKTVSESLRARGLTLACAESCTGGLVAKLVTDLAGSSEIFEGGVVSYSNDVKMKILGVSEETLASHGAVSEETAEEMALGVMERLGSDIGVSTTGIAGPGGGTAEKPVGTVCFGVSSRYGVRTYTKRFKDTLSRDEIRRSAADFALSLVEEECEKFDGAGPGQKRFTKNDEGFICAHCGREVLPLGYTSRNHCPFCLWSVHLDVNPGDRASECGGLLEPVGAEPNTKKGGYTIIHKCVKCGEIRRNKAAHEAKVQPDDLSLIIKLTGRHDY